MAYFATGFRSVAQLLLLISGAAAAVIVFLAAVLLVICLAGMTFDRVTQAMANRWEMAGRQPGGKLGQIILDHHRSSKA